MSFKQWSFNGTHSTQYPVNLCTCTLQIVKHKPQELNMRNMGVLTILENNYIVIYLDNYSQGAMHRKCLITNMF